MTLNPLDRRLNAYRPDLADSALEGQVKAARFVQGLIARICAPIADLRPAPSMDKGIDTQLLFGDVVKVFDRADGWAWIKNLRDGYVGYALCDAIDWEVEPAAATHRVSAQRTFIYPVADLKHPAGMALSLGSALAVVGHQENRGTLYAELAAGQGFVIASHVKPIEAHAADYVSVAEKLLDAPYLWAGVSAFGIDCSGLVQLSMLMAGANVLRDSDLQAASIGSVLDPEAELERGDLIFWKGHVGIMTDGETLLHANGHTMNVSREKLSDAIARIGYLYGQPTARRRP